MRSVPGERRLVIESPDIHQSSKMQAYITQEATRPCKQWVHEVLSSKREADRVRLRTDQFVLLPDVDAISKRSLNRLVPYLLDRELPSNATPPEPPPSSFWPANSPLCAPCLERRWRPKRAHPPLHWLALLTDTSLKTVRDLRGQHVPMLEQLHALCCNKIQEETGIPSDQIMVYVHYPPSVYHLHIHFKHPVGPHVSHDTFRIHSVASIINNLKIDPEYYAKSDIQLPVYPCTELYSALGLDSTEESVAETPTDPFLKILQQEGQGKRCLKLPVRHKSNQTENEPDFIGPSPIEKAQPSPGPVDPDPCSPPVIPSTSPGSRPSTHGRQPETRSPSAT
jgi:hypothetical protein